MSRVRTLDSLRLLQVDQDGLRSLSGLKHDEYLAAWERGGGPFFHWEWRARALGMEGEGSGPPICSVDSSDDATSRDVRP